MYATSKALNFPLFRDNSLQKRFNPYISLQQELSRNKRASMLVSLKFLKTEFVVA